jgi:hypothetical protein
VGRVLLPRLAPPREGLTLMENSIFKQLALAEPASKLLTLRIDARERLADPLLLLGDLVQCRHPVPSRQSIGWPELINLFGVYHYDAHGATAE